MEDIISVAKAEFTRAQERLTKDLETTPDDKLNWSPAETARTPVQLVAHAAMGTEGISGMLAGKPFPFKDFQDMDKVLREKEKAFTSKEQVKELLEKTSAAYLAWLDGLTPEQVGSTVSLPFGDVPMAYAVTFAADHLRCHAAQLEYVQTIYGDHNWHM